MSDNLREFTLDLDKVAQTLPAETVQKAHRALHLQALGRIVRRTPVDTGRARGNWQSSTGQPITSTVERLDPSGASSLQEGQQVAARIAPFDASFIANSLDYITVLENGGFVPPDPGPSSDPRPERKGRVLVRGGYSVQAPQGMVGLTFQELEDSIGASDA